MDATAPRGIVALVCTPGMRKRDMDNRILDVEDAKERLAAWKGRADQLSANAEALSERMRELRMTVNDPNHLVEVTVDSSGGLMRIEFSQRIKQVRVEDLSQIVMETLKDAKRQLADEAGQIVASTLGTESAAGRAIAERVRDQLMPSDDSERR
ncbi:YbaB/EbfC family nucleoid-associated protein [Glycomyces sp. NPDC046736]|uniref:YbaB/EbfC family nucleoid-associated protein n=1 Tax=Glycomyces sp. NPDC046736 TaxID=3155615 RepID=UPI0033CCA8E4